MIKISYPAYEPDMTVYRDMHAAEKNVVKECACRVKQESRRLGLA